MSSHDAEHARALLQTGFWGRRAAGVLFLAATTGRLGLVLRSAHVQEPETWGIVGGAIDPKEDKRLAAAREAREEVGFRVDPKTLILLDTFTKGDFTYTTFLGVLPQECPPCHLDWENDDLAWFSIGSLPPNLHPGLAATLSKPKVLHRLEEICRGLGPAFSVSLALPFRAVVGGLLL
jgi:8-oxo-dGTP pyrophosphatase MutT (NUDIX family)